MTRLILRVPLLSRRTAAPVLRRTRAQRTVLFALAGVVLFQFGLNVLLDTVKPEWRDPEYGHRLKAVRAIHKAEPHRPLVVVLGSSRPQMGLSPSSLGLGDGPTAPKVYNLSAAGCGPLHELMNLRRLLADGVTPDFLLVEVLPPVLVGDGPAEGLLHPAKLSLADVRRMAPYCRDPSALWVKWAKARLLPWHSLRLYLMSHWAGGFLPWQARQDFMWTKMDADGWLPYFFAEVPAENRAKGLADAEKQYMGYLRQEFRVSPLMDRAYRDLLAECRGHGIKVGFVVMPEGPTFRGWYPPGARAKIGEYLRDLGREANGPVFDAHAWLDDERLFADGHHLMRAGAERFSRRLGAEGVGPWVRGERR